MKEYSRTGHKNIVTSYYLIVSSVYSDLAEVFNQLEANREGGVVPRIFSVVMNVAHLAFLYSFTFYLAYPICEFYTQSFIFIQKRS